MRTLLLAAALLVPLFRPGPVRADAPLPEGTVQLRLYEGESKQVQAPNGAQVVCDDPGVAHGDIVDERFVIVAVHAGQTLCGVRSNGVPRGVYLVVVESRGAKP